MQKGKTLNHKNHSFPVFYCLRYNWTLNFSVGIPIKTEEFNFDWDQSNYSNGFERKRKITRVFSLFLFYFFMVRMLLLQNAGGVSTYRCVHTLDDLLFWWQMNKWFGFKFKFVQSTAKRTLRTKVSRHRKVRDSEDEFVKKFNKKNYIFHTYSNFIIVIGSRE